MTDLKEVKQAIEAYRLHSSFVREIVKTWYFSNKAMPQDWAQLISAVLESGQQLLWRCFLKEEVKILEQQEKAKGLEISLNQILGKVHTLILRIKLIMITKTCLYVAQQL